MDSFPIPKVDELFAKLAGGQIYSEFDLSHAYEQIGAYYWMSHHVKLRQSTNIVGYSSISVCRMEFLRLLEYHREQWNAFSKEYHIWLHT